MCSFLSFPVATHNSIPTKKNFHILQRRNFIWLNYQTHQQKIIFKYGKRTNVIRPMAQSNESVKGNHYCIKCEYKTTSKYYIKQHVESKHEGIFYNCDGCGYRATQKYILKLHVESDHEGICYSCKQCGYKAK